MLKYLFSCLGYFYLDPQTLVSKTVYTGITYILVSNKDCGYSLERPHRGDSPEPVLKAKIITLSQVVFFILKQSFLTIKIAVHCIGLSTLWI